MGSRGDEAMLVVVILFIAWCFRTGWKLVSWTFACLYWLIRHPVILSAGAVVTAIGFAGTRYQHSWAILAGGAGTAVLGTFLVSRRWPAHYEAWIACPFRSAIARFDYQRFWQPAMVASGLTSHIGGQVVLPRIRKVVSRPGQDDVRVLLPAGQVFDQWCAAADQLATTFVVPEARVRRTEIPNELIVSFVRVDPLLEDVPPLVGEDRSMDSLPLGYTEDGSRYCLGLRGTHVLIAGETGSGKSSVLWAIIAGLGPMIVEGTAQLWICDPKGGMELAAGRPIFDRFIHGSASTSVELEVAEALESLVSVMRDRQDRLRGVARCNTPSREEPQIVSIIDELAALTAYGADRDAGKRIAAALKLLLSQGRSVGVTVIGALQDPRKENLTFRDLFPTRIGLRLSEPEHVAMVLGEGARRQGARCDQIPESLPGVGYVKTDGVREPQRVRFSHFDDESIAIVVDAIEQFRVPRASSADDGEVAA